MSLNLNHFLDKVTTPVTFGKMRSYQVKRYFKIFININYIFGFLYAFYFYIRSPRTTQMFERRLWAFECWAILSFYGLFIYLFFLEKSALEGQRGLYRFSQIQARGVIDASVEKVIAWFKFLEKNPKKYQFNTHQGVEILSGSLTKPGSIFATREIFFGVTIRLKFRVTKVKNTQFEFEVIAPKWLRKMGIKGKFLLVPVSKSQTILQLMVFNETKNFLLRVISTLFLYLSPVRLIVATQISREVGFIKKQVEKG